VVPISGGLIQRQATLLQDLQCQVLCCTPSYALCIAEALETAQIDRRTLKLEVGIFGAEPWSEELRGEIERRLGIAAVNIYGLAEIVGPGVSAECIEARNGSHIQEDHFLPEIVDPETGEMVFFDRAEVSDARRFRRAPALAIVDAPRMDHDDGSLGGAKAIGHLNDPASVVRKSPRAHRQVRPLVIDQHRRLKPPQLPHWLHELRIIRQQRRRIF
jgi:hypothetical protein